MKIHLLSVSIFLFSILFPICAINAGESAVKLASSPMSEGNWVKINVDTTGVYEISYESLLAMGFSEPEKVAILGRGGAQYDINFTQSDGYTPIYSDKLKPVSILHYNGKIYFYGCGPQSFSLNRTKDYPGIEGTFNRTGNNIYSSTGLYFLTDTQSALIIEPAEDNANMPVSAELDYAYGMISHERDITQNNTATGQIFFGESIGFPESEMKWQLKLNGAVPNSAGVMECAFYYDINGSGTWSYGISPIDEETPSHTIQKVNSSSLRKISPAQSRVNIPDCYPEVFIKVTPDNGKPEVSNLDYWTLTYRRNIPTLYNLDGKAVNQEIVGFPQSMPGEKSTFTIPGGSDFIVFDVSDPATPKLVPVKAKGDDGIAAFTAGPSAPVMTIFNPLRPQLQIKGYDPEYSHISNQNLHQAAAEGAELVIICVPGLKIAASQIARLHKDYDNIDTLIATTEECYNEFSSGLPDPIAYRALLKYVYGSPVPCKNVLFLGPITGDNRGVTIPRNPYEYIIGYQSAVISQERGAMNANDIYGMTANYINVSNLHVNDMKIGVGLLPVNSESEANIIIDKIEKYLQAENLELYLNAFTNIGGFGDRHTHDSQALHLSNYISSLSDYSIINSNLPVDAYGNSGAREKLFENLDKGQLVVNYFGHGDPKQLNQTGDFFKSSDVYNMRNTYLPFMGFAGCSLSIPDKGIRGLGESLILSTHHGAIGALLATRETWSGENAVLFDNFYKRMFEGSESSDSGIENLTIGEIFALTKTDLSSNNELGYQLMCDPALKIVIPSRRINFSDLSPELKIGSHYIVKGYISDNKGDGEIDPTFNGKVVCRLMEPVKSVISEDLCTGESDNPFRFQISDVQMSMCVSEVTDGHFTAELYIPPTSDENLNAPVKLQVSAYSSEQRIGAAGLLTGTLKPSSNPTAAKDAVPPVIEHIYFDNSSMELHVRVSDDVAPSLSDYPLNPSFRLILDGSDYPSASHSMTVPSVNSRAYDKSVILHDLTPGYHVARVEVADAAGNRSSAETSFAYVPAGGSLSLTIDRKALEDTILFYSPDGVPDSTDLVIIDQTGNQRARFSFSLEGFEWDGTDNEGIRLPGGLYKAYLIQTGDASDKSCSSLIDLPVIGQ